MLTRYWANVAIPHGTNGFDAVCPFCATPLVGYPGYVRLIFQDNVDWKPHLCCPFVWCLWSFNLLPNLASPVQKKLQRNALTMTAYNRNLWNMSALLHWFKGEVRCQDTVTLRCINFVFHKRVCSVYNFTI